MISSGKCSRLITRRSVEFVSWTCKGTIGRFSPTALLRQNHRVNLLKKYDCADLQFIRIKRHARRQPSRARDLQRDALVVARLGAIPSPPLPPSSAPPRETLPAAPWESPCRSCQRAR